MIEGEKIISESQEVANVFNHYFDTAVDELGTFNNDDVLTDVGDITDPVEKAIKMFENHPSILKIQELVPRGFDFTFHEIT